MRKTILIISSLLVVTLLASCATSGNSGTANEGNAFINQFDPACIMVKGKSIKLLDDVLLGDETLILETDEYWSINFNGFAIRANGVAIEVKAGKLEFKDSFKYLDDDSPMGGVFSEFEAAVAVAPDAMVIVKSGVFRGEEYAFTVASGGTLIIEGGRIIGDELPVYGDSGWKGTFKGGVFSGYDPSYEEAVASDRYITRHLSEKNEDFADQWDQSFSIVFKDHYMGQSQLTLEAPKDSSACFRLYKAYKYDGFTARNAVYDYQWMLKPGQEKTVDFTSGKYVLKVAEGDIWTDENAFGDNGWYWNMDPFEFLDNHAYFIESSTAAGMSNTDNKNGFLSGI